MSAARKKAVILAILEILRRNTNADHRLRQKDIIQILETDYDTVVTRHSVRANLDDLIDAGYPVVYEDGWYYEHELCKSELDILTDSLMFNPSIPYRQSRDMIAKIREMGGKWYKPSIGQSMNRPANPQFMFSYEILHDAITSQTQVVFEYGDYHIDKHLHPRVDDEGQPKKYTVNPYRIILSNGRCYLVCNVDQYSNVAHFRIDRVMNIEPTEIPFKDPREVEGLEYGLSIPEYMTAHTHMFSGKIISATLNIDKSIISEALEWFGMDIEFDHETEDTVNVLVRSDEGSLYYWLNMYSEFARRI